jgi:phosphate transport system substrate-binding protein
MNKKFAKTLAGLVATAALIVPASAANATDIAGSGSSFAYNGVYKCASLYEADNVTYTSTGSGTGRTNFRTNKASFPFALSDGLYTAGTEPTGYTMVPLFGGPVVFAYNKYSGIPSGLKLDSKTVSAILKGTVTKWNASAIKALNPGKTLPNRAIKVFYRAGTSGTNENLSEYLRQTGNAGWTKNQTLLTAATALAAGSVSKATSSLLADAVESRSNLGAFGYFDLSDAKTANVSLVSLKNRNGQFVAPTASAGALMLNAQTTDNSGADRVQGTATASLSAALGGTVNGAIDFTKNVKNAYQLTILTYGIGSKGGSDPKDVAVEGFFKFIINTCMPSQASRLGYVALTGTMKTKALAQAALIAQ